jgi:uncharacterized delta-60 repeat protein
MNADRRRLSSEPKTSIGASAGHVARLTVFGCSLLCVAATLAVGTARTQSSFERCYGGEKNDCGYSVALTSDRGCVVVGSTSSFGAGRSDIFLVKTNAKGDTLWTRTFGGSDYDVGYSVQQTTDGGYVIAGTTRSLGAGRYDACLIRTDASGSVAWFRTYGDTSDDEARSVEQTADGGFVTTGCTESRGAGQGDVYLVRTNAKGDTMWTKTFGGASRDEGFSVWQTTDKGFVIAGLTQSFGAGGDDVYLIKTNARGDTLWTRTFGGNDDDFGYSVSQTTDGGYVIAGLSESFGAGGEDFYLIRTDAHGDTLSARENRGQSRGDTSPERREQRVADVSPAPASDSARYSPRFPGTLWTRTYGCSNTDEAHSVQRTSDGGFVVAGSTYSLGAGNFDFCLVRTDADGKALWTKTFGGAGDDGAWSLAQAADGGFFVAGYRSSATSDRDVFLVRTDSAGNIQAERSKAH